MPIPAIRKQFLLDPSVHFLNHGSFGSCPKPVFEVYQDWQRRLERQPVQFLARDIFEELARSRETLAKYVHCDPDDLVFFPNPTTAMNMVARSIDLSPGSEVLTSNHEYGAMNRVWDFVTRRRGAHYVIQPIEIPVASIEQAVDQFFSGVTEHTRAIFISHISSQTALTFPVKEICQRGKEHGLLTIVDGAHIPGHLPLDLRDIGADIYTGACHKWLCAPKGAAFLYASKEIQNELNPLVVSWGYHAETPRSSQFLDYHEWQGTKDYSSELSVPAAIDFCQTPEWQREQERCRRLASTLWTQLLSIFPLRPVYQSESQFAQMFAVEVPFNDPAATQKRLYDEFRVEVPVYRWENRVFLRVSLQGYNDSSDIEALVAGLTSLTNELAQ